VSPAKAVAEQIDYEIGIVCLMPGTCTVRIPMNISVQNVGSSKDGYYLGMKFVDLITAESEGIGFSTNPSTYKFLKYIINL
jgi:hypothetical protein